MHVSLCMCQCCMVLLCLQVLNRSGKGKIRKDFVAAPSTGATLRGTYFLIIFSLLPVLSEFMDSACNYLRISVMDHRDTNSRFLKALIGS